MYNRRDYIPRNVLQFLALCKGVLNNVNANKAAWSHIPAPAIAKMSAMVDDLEVAIDLAAAQRTPANTFARNTKQAETTKALRQFVNQYLRFEPVTDTNRVEMGIPNRDTIPTPVGDPVGQAEADISYPGRTQLVLNIKHVTGTPHDSRAYYGYRIYYGVFAADHTPPQSGKDLHVSKFSRKKRNLFNFQPEDSSKTAYFCIRYENGKGGAGPWGPMCSAIIP